MSLNEKIDMLRLYRSKNVGPTKFRKLIDKYGSATKAIEDMKQGSVFGVQNIVSRQAAEKEMESVENFGAQLIFYNDDLYPELLKNIYDSDCILTVKGNIDLLKKEKVAIVGARNASVAGKQWTSQFANKLGKHNFVIVSGMARGIDTVAHTSTIKTGTIAVFGSGIDKVYPLENTSLYKDISQNGLIVSGFAFGEEPHARMFVKRNQLIAGLSWGVIVVDASINSGSIITAKYAIEAGRDVFVVPNHPFDIRSRGGNALIKEGAHLLEDVDDFLSVYSHIGRRFIENNKPIVMNTVEKLAIKSIKNFEKKSLTTDGCSKSRDKILELLSNVPSSIDKLVDLSGLSLEELFDVINELELEDLIERDSSGMVILRYQ
ncbi:DNA-processing protein DprA [Candidatus Gromoviella agglomerans]|uniref:DNA-processing protein DprA n=1 Tax=Candidatus Gromoviella agglomerans TaxID=2806609 RepID=UPI001E36D782|nr:DNA-processing protein DprA [Candidatus Gromoviella agglomerans]UFX98402.1 DNA-protecting protein DprA [Candidatus Gromoviella agglomerans]